MTGWSPVDGDLGTWRNEAGDVLSTHYFPQPPDLPAPLGDMDSIRSAYRRLLRERGAIIELEALTTVRGPVHLASARLMNSYGLRRARRHANSLRRYRSSQRRHQLRDATIAPNCLTRGWIRQRPVKETVAQCLDWRAPPGERWTGTATVVDSAPWTIGLGTTQSREVVYDPTVPIADFSVGRGRALREVSGVLSHALSQDERRAAIAEQISHGHRAAVCGHYRRKRRAGGDRAGQRHATRAAERGTRRLIRTAAVAHAAGTRVASHARVSTRSGSAPGASTRAARTRAMTIADAALAKGNTTRRLPAAHATACAAGRLRTARCVGTASGAVTRGRSPAGCLGTASGCGTADRGATPLARNGRGTRAPRGADERQAQEQTRVANRLTRSKSTEHRNLDSCG